MSAIKRGSFSEEEAIIFSPWKRYIPKKTTLLTAIAIAVLGSAAGVLASYLLTLTKASLSLKANILYSSSIPAGCLLIYALYRVGLMKAYFSEGEVDFHGNNEHEQDLLKQIIATEQDDKKARTLIKNFLKEKND